MNTATELHLFISICHNRKVFVKKPLSPVHQWHAGQDKDEHPGPRGQTQCAVTVVTLAMAKIPNSLSALLKFLSCHFYYRECYLVLVPGCALICIKEPTVADSHLSLILGESFKKNLVLKYRLS